jgi:hypothetical protein
MLGQYAETTGREEGKNRKKLSKLFSLAKSFAGHYNAKN